MKKFVLLFVLINGLSFFIQSANNECYVVLANCDERIIGGYDSLGRKQGFWNEKIYFDDYLLFYEDSVTSFNAMTNGFYVDDKKVGIWDVFLYEAEEKVIYANIYYDNDIMIYQITYSNSKIVQFTKVGYKQRQYNTGSSGIIYVLNRVVFNNDGKIKFKESYAPDGVFEKYNYQ